MTETQATSGAAGTSTNPVDKETQGALPGGHAAVGRATVPATEAAPPKSAPQSSQESGAAPAAGGSGEAAPAGSSQSASTGPSQAGPSGSSQSAPAASGGQRSEDSARQPENRRPEEPSGKAAESSQSVRPTAGVPGMAGSRTPLAGGSVRYTRAPGMAAPPDTQPAGDGRSTEPERASGAVTATATVPLRTGAVTLAPMDAPSVPITARPGGLGTGRPGLATLPSGRSVGAARVADAVRGARSISSAAAARGPRRARLVLKRVDPWSVMKFSFAVSLVLFIVTIVATSVLYLALDAMGVFDSVNASLGDLLSSAASSESGGSGFKITAGGVIGTAALLGLINVVLVTALATLGAFIYNVCADLVGGVEMTLSERE